MSVRVCCVVYDIVYFGMHSLTSSLLPEQDMIKSTYLMRQR